MSKPWFERTFDFSFSVELLPNVLARLRGTPARLEELVRGREGLTARVDGQWSAQEGAYAALQGTKPQTLSFSLTDSPIGLAAWITEKFRSWSDCGGDIESVIPLDDLLTDISLYWFGDSLTGSVNAGAFGAMPMSGTRQA